MSELPPSPPSPPERLSRRKFSERVLLWLTGIFGLLATALFAIPFVGYLLGPLRKNPGLWVKLGPITKYPLGQTRQENFDSPLRQPWDGMTAKTSVFVRYMGKGLDTADQFLVFAANCAHLGCPVSWFPQSSLFMCPCHGGVYYENGDRASGPPPRGLFQCVWQVRDGILEIQAPHYPTLQNTLKEKDQP